MSIGSGFAAIPRSNKSVRLWLGYGVEGGVLAEPPIKADQKLIKAKCNKIFPTDPRKFAGNRRVLAYPVISIEVGRRVRVMRSGG
jgi:hypothetical protein